MRHLCPMFALDTQFHSMHKKESVISRVKYTNLRRPVINRTHVFGFEFKKQTWTN